MSDLRILVNLSNYGRKLILSPELEARLNALGTVTHYNPDVEPLTREAFLERVAATDVMITSWRSTFLESGDLGRTGDLKLLVHGAGSVKSVITKEIIASGVRTVQCAMAIAKAVAQYTVGLIILGLRNSAGRYTKMRAGERPEWPTYDLEGVTVGLVGLSQVGRRIPPLLAPFECRILAYDPFWKAEDAAKLGVTLVDLDTLVEQSDVVSLHAPVLPETRNMIDARRIARMKQGALFVNTARGALVDQDALFERCLRGELVAYLDVTTPEPLPKEHPAWQSPYVFITPHIAGVSAQTCRRIGDMIVDAVTRFKRGEPLVGEVTAERYELLA